MFRLEGGISSLLTDRACAVGKALYSETFFRNYLIILIKQYHLLDEIDAIIAGYC
jgi:hypothetical protein